MTIVDKMAANKSKKSSKPPRSKSPYDPNYFRFPHPALAAFTSSLVVYLIVTTLAPHSLPDFLGPIAQFGKYMGTQQFNLVIFFCCFALFTHSLEAAYAGKVCHDRRYNVMNTFKWTLCTFIFGFPTMIRLLSHKPRSKSN